MNCKKNEFLLYKMNSYCLLCIWYDLEQQSHVLRKEILKLTQSILLIYC